MRKVPLKISEESSWGLAAVYSPRVEGEIRTLIERLSEFPELGSSNVRESLRRRYGGDIRKLAVSTFILVYRFDGSCVEVLALVPGPSVR